ncbi:hypothetical protein ACB092_M003000 [Castanea dentata]
MKVLSEIALQIIKKRKKKKKRAGTSDGTIAHRARRLCSKNDKGRFSLAQLLVNIILVFDSGMI